MDPFSEISRDRVQWGQERYWLWQSGTRQQAAAAWASVNDVSIWQLFWRKEFCNKDKGNMKITTSFCNRWTMQLWWTCPCFVSLISTDILWWGSSGEGRFFREGLYTSLHTREKLPCPPGTYLISEPKLVGRQSSQSCWREVLEKVNLTLLELVCQCLSEKLQLDRALDSKIAQCKVLGPATELAF